jgi:hypothetical protein
MVSIPTWRGLSPLDSPDMLEIVRRAYKRKALETHPDKLGPTADEGEKLVAEAQFRKVCPDDLLKISTI